MTVRNIVATFTRPADTTPYTTGDLVANSTTAGSVVPLELRGFAVNNQASTIIRRVELVKSGTSTTNAAFRVHIFRRPPATITNGDNGAYSVSGAADYIDSLNITMDRAFTDGAAGIGVPLVGSEILVRFTGSTTQGQSLFALIEARGDYTPASAEIFTLTVDSVDD